jgi:molecular chaperone GrpE
MSDERAHGRRTVEASAPQDGADAFAAIDGELPSSPAGDALDALVEEPSAGTVESELALLAAQRDEYLSLAQRTQADFENYRKRVAREAAAAEQRGVGRLARELLPALDSLDRALEHAVAEHAEQMVEGLRLVQRDLRGALERAGIEAFGQAGEQFDPGQHEAVAQQSRDGVAPGLIVEVFQPGYRIAGGGILRPARVMVAG